MCRRMNHSITRKRDSKCCVCCTLRCHHPGTTKMGYMHVQHTQLDDNYNYLLPKVPSGSYTIFLYHITVTNCCTSPFSNILLIVSTAHALPISVVAWFSSAYFMQSSRRTLSTTTSNGLRRHSKTTCTCATFAKCRKPFTPSGMRIWTMGRCTGTTHRIEYVEVLFNFNVGDRFLQILGQVLRLLAS